MLAYPVGTLLAGGVLALGSATLLASRFPKLRFPLPPADSRLGCIDGLRGYLALSVMVHHFVIWTQVTRLGGAWSRPEIDFFNSLGAGCVALFFMTTGFLFYSLVLRGFGATSWTSTYLTRVFRIVPLTAFSTGLVLLLVAYRQGGRSHGPIVAPLVQWISTWGEPPLMGYDDSGRLNAYVLWSLWYEWLFYLFVLPSCAAVSDVVRRLAPSWLFAVVLLLLTLLVRRVTDASGLPVYMPLFAMGMVAHEIQRSGLARRYLRSPIVAPLALAALGVGMTAFDQPYTLVPLSLYGFFFICVACGNPMFGILATSGAKVLGECSFGIYLLHGLVLAVLFVDASSIVDLIPTPWIGALLPLPALVVTTLATPVYVMIERPFVRWGKALAQPWTRRRLSIDDPRIEVAP